MPRYIDGFAHPIPLNKLDQYQHLAAAVAQIWKEHGALDYQEWVGDDMHLEGTRSFSEALSANSDEAILFGWLVFESREARDLANARVAADPRIAELMADADVGFDPQRMAYGGFLPLEL
jgi:uncharacterized protein YbaA (DUF1428 family)